MNYSQKMGGVAALIEAATFVVGLGLAVTLLAPYMIGDLEWDFNIISPRINHL